MPGISTAETNLYRAIAELGYTIAKADDVLEPEEAKAFYRIIQQELGEEARHIAESRFDILESHLSPSVDEAYNHAMYVIKRNKSALDEDMIEKFKNVIMEVAQVAGICKEEKAIIDKFQRDIISIYFTTL